MKPRQLLHLVALGLAVAPGALGAQEVASAPPPAPVASVPTPPPVPAASVPAFSAVLAAQAWTQLAAQVDLRVQRGKGPELPKEMRVFVRSSPKGQGLYAEFTSPANMRGTAFLALTSADLADEYFMYVRTLRRVKRVASYTENFMLRDFLSLYLLKPRAELWQFGPGQCVQLEGQTLWRFEATPAAPDTQKRTGYARLVHFVDPADLVIRRTEFLDEEGSVMRRQWVTAVERVGDQVLPVEFQTQDLAEGVGAKIRLHDLRVNEAPPEDVFSVRRLKGL